MGRAEEGSDDFFAYSLNDLMDIDVVTASRYEQNPLDVPANVTVITSKEIKRKGYKTLLDVFRDVSMIDIVSPGQGYFTDIGGRGVNQRINMGKHWQILIDGHDMVWTQFNRNHVTDAWVSLDNIKRIEIVKGPASAVWGANAYLGVINIITKDVEDIQKGSVSFGAGDNHFYTVSAMAGGKLGKNGSLISSVSLTQEDYPRKVKEWSEVKGEDVWLRGNDSEFLNWYTKVKLGDFFMNAMVSTDDSHHAMTSFSIGANDAIFSVEKYFVDIGWDHQFENGNSLKATVYYDRMEWGDNAQYEDNPFNGPVVADDGSLAGSTHFVREMQGADDVYGMSLNSTVSLRDDLDLLLGAEYEMRDIKRWSFPAVLDFYDIQAPKYHVYESGLYSQLSYRPTEKLNFVGGARYDYNEIYKENISPRAAIVTRPCDSVVWKFMYGQAYKEPSLHELYYYRANAVYGNPQLEPEENETYETQLIYSHKDNCQVSLSWFFIDMSELIIYKTRDGSLPLDGATEFPVSQVPDGTKSYRQQMNTGRYVSKGVELGFKCYPSDSFILTFDGTYQDAVDERDDHARLHYTPKYKIVSSLTWNLKNKHSFCLSGRFVGNQTAPDVVFTEPGYPFNMTEDLSTKESSYFVSSLAFTTRELLEGLDLLLKFENITDNEYYDPARHVFYHQPEFNVYGKLTYRF